MVGFRDHDEQEGEAVCICKSASFPVTLHVITDVAGANL